jgi:hypothetical protein
MNKEVERPQTRFERYGVTEKRLISGHMTNARPHTAAIRSFSGRENTKERHAKGTGPAPFLGSLQAFLHRKNDAIAAVSNASLGLGCKVPTSHLAAITRLINIGLRFHLQQKSSDATDEPRLSSFDP